MKTLRSLLIVFALILTALPLVITAQDGGPINVHPATPMTEELIEYPDGSLNLTPGSISLPTAQAATEELIDYPVTFEATDPCVDDDPDDLLIPLCPHTATPTPRPQSTPVSEEPAIVNGLWILEPGSSSFSSSGTCQSDYGDNDGPPTYGSEEEIPRVPVCMSGDNEWLSVSSSSPFPRVLEGIYSTQELGRELLMTNGVTSGSVNVTQRREYRVLSPTLVEFSYTIQEEGGCTRTSTLRYKMVEPNDLVCSGMIITPEFEATLMSTPVSTPQAGETPQVPATPEPPVKTGRYVIALPVDDPACTAEVMPEADTIAVSYDDNQNMFIDFGGSSYTLYWDGVDYYSYREGNRFSMSVITYEGGASFAWSKRIEAGDPNCYISSELLVEGAPTATPIPVEPTNEAYTDVTTLAGSSYSVTWDAPDYLCAPEYVDTLPPELDQAILTAQDDGNMLLSVGGADYLLTNTDGIHGFSEFHDDGSMLSITMNGFYEGLGAGTFGVIGGDGAFCMAQLTFTPVN